MEAQIRLKNACYCLLLLVSACYCVLLLVVACLGDCLEDVCGCLGDVCWIYWGILLHF